MAPFVALSGANGAPPRDSRVQGRFSIHTEAGGARRISTAPVHPPDCFMMDPNSLINHRAVSLRPQLLSDRAQNDWKAPRPPVVVEPHT